MVPSLARFMDRLMEIPIASRKVLLAITRVQVFPFLENTNAYTRSRIALRFDTELRQNIVFHNRFPRREEVIEMRLYDIILPIASYFECPLSAGFLSIHIRSAPYHTYSDIPAVLEDGFRKELTAALAGYERFSTNFSSFLSYSGHHRDQPFSPNIPPNPRLANEIFMSLLSTKHSLRNKRIYPRVAKKTFHREVTKEIIEDLRTSFPEDVHHVETIADLEKIYYRYGYQPSGAVEMRSAWKYNDLKPRVYYAQGPTVYQASKYVQPIFNALLDSFEVCHRILRFSNPNLSLQDSYLYIYDYSSFTSSMTESTRFIFALADFFDDVDVEILDVRSGWQCVSVGDLLREYAQTCNVFPEFSVHRLLPSEGGFAMARFHNCGMLGVPGNLASCTVLHAINLMFLSGSMFASRCVGDDGLAITTLEAEDFNDCVRNMGEVEESKTDRWGSNWSIGQDFRRDSWHFTKRPITRRFDQISKGELFIWPSLELILKLVDEYHMSSLPTRDVVRHRKVAQQVNRLLSDVASNFHHCSEEGLTLLRMYLINMYRTMGWNVGGEIRTDATEEGGSVIIGRVPSMEELKDDPYARNLEEMRGQVIRVPLMRFYDDPVFDPPCVFVSRSSAGLSVLEAIGVVKCEELLFEDVEIEDNGSLYQTYLKSQYNFSYRYSVLERLPSWYQ